jgi:broad specificity phosphatase PhoE
VVLVRHAEKVDQSADPALSEAGRARAQALAAVLADSGVTRVLVTPLIRTGQTAAPTATAAGIEPVAIPLDGGVAVHAARVAAAVRESDPSDVVLVVGHSNTVPDIARALGDVGATALADCDYDRLLVVRLGETPSVMRSRYGAPSESC